MPVTGSLFCREYRIQHQTLKTFHCVMPIAPQPSSTWVSTKWVSGWLVWWEKAWKRCAGGLDFRLCFRLRTPGLSHAAGWAGSEQTPSQTCSFSWFTFPVRGGYVGWRWWVGGSWHIPQGAGSRPVRQQFSVSRSAVRSVANNTSSSKCLQTMYLFVCFVHK